MNQKEFMQRADELIDKMDIDALRNCLHQLARMTLENKRESFLQLLEDCCCDDKTSDTNGRVQYRRVISDEKVKDKLKELKGFLTKIEDGEICISAHGYEDYSSGYWSSDWVWEYEDHEGIGKTLKEAVIFAHDCMNDCRYEEAVTIFDLVINITVFADDEDGGDTIELSFEEMIDENLVDVNHRKLALDILYSNYQLHPISQRASVLFSYFSYPYFKELHMEDVLSVGREELKDINLFLQSWIEYLMHQSGEVAARLLKEAILYYKGAEGLLDMARKGYKEHPSIYLSALLEYEKTHDYETMKEIGTEALEKIDKDLKIRGEVAIKTAQAAYYTRDNETMKKCWYEAFFSDSTVPNYLRLFCDREATQEYKDLAERRINELQIYKQYYNAAYEDKKNNATDYEYKYLCFFSGHIDKIHHWCREQKNSLGWSGHFIRYGLDLMILYLYADSQLKKAGKHILERVSRSVGFDESKNLVFMKENAVFESDMSASSENIFWDVFCLWKLNYSISIDEINRYVDWLESVINRRVDGIVGGKYRRKYNDVALLVAALGEVKESMGVKMAKSIIIKEYMNRYPRHNAFRGALKEYMD